MSRPFPLVVAGAALCLMSGVARAQSNDDPPPRRDAAEATRNGLFLPLTQAAAIGRQRVTALVLGGGDSLATPPFPGGEGGGLHPVPLAYARVEGALFDRVSLFVGVEYSGMEAEAVRAFNPSVGLRVRLLEQARAGVDLGLGVLYRNHGFAEAEGEFELSLLVAHRFERVGLYGNVVYGQGLNPDDRDAELRLAALAFLGDRFTVGADVRARVDLSNGGPDPENPASGDFDLVAGPVASAAVGPVVFLAQVGAHALLQNRALGAGVLGQGGVGLSF